MLRVRDEARWIERCVSSILPLCDEVIILDDHSTDGTPELCKALRKTTVYPSAFDGLNEARDKNFLLGIVELAKPDWIIAIDGDEVLAPGCEAALLKAMQGQWPCLSLRVRYLWDREDQVRTDGVYGDFHRESVFRPDGSRFTTNGNGGNFHCGNVPAFIRQRRAVLHDVSLLHFGYMHKADRERKYCWYNARDPKNSREDQYRHMVIGDVFPAESKFQHGGPLKLEALN